MKQVRDGSRVLQFEGVLLASSTSWRPGSTRWVEFKLYRTESGNYVLGRVGVSLLYHAPECSVVRRNNLKEAPYEDLDRNAEPCPQCHPDDVDHPLIFPERPRYWAQICETPESAVDGLYKYDQAGSRYLTLVAQRLLDDASEVDERINKAYRVQTIL